MQDALYMYALLAAYAGLYVRAIVGMGAMICCERPTGACTDRKRWQTLSPVEEHARQSSLGCTWSMPYLLLSEVREHAISRTTAMVWR